MFSLLSEIIKPILGFAFGTKAKAKISMVVLLMGLIVAFSVYVTSKYSGMKTQLAETELIIQGYEMSAKLLSEKLQHNEKMLLEQSNTFAVANRRRVALEEKLNESARLSKEAQDVFEKECGRVDRLMQKKASLVVRYANRATERVWDEFETATTPSND